MFITNPNPEEFKILQRVWGMVRQRAHEWQDEAEWLVRAWSEDAWNAAEEQRLAPWHEQTSEAGGAGAPSEFLAPRPFDRYDIFAKVVRQQILTGCPAIPNQTWARRVLLVTWLLTAEDCADVPMILPPYQPWGYQTEGQRHHRSDERPDSWRMDEMVALLGGPTEDRRPLAVNAFWRGEEDQWAAMVEKSLVTIGVDGPSAAGAIGVTGRAVGSESNTELPSSARSPRKGIGGRKPVYSARDKRIAGEWYTATRMKQITYAVFAKERGYKESEVRKAVERHRKHDPGYKTGY